VYGEDEPSARVIDRQGQIGPEPGQLVGPRNKARSLPPPHCVLKRSPSHSRPSALRDNLPELNRTQPIPASAGAARPRNPGTVKTRSYPSLIWPANFLIDLANSSDRATLYRDR
jgi:hypothetical protein